MKFLLPLICILLSSCFTIKQIPLKGSYPETPIIYHSKKSFDKAWDNLIDVFAQKGLSIKLIDKSSGLIVSDRTQLITTIEDKNGKLFNDGAYIAVPVYISNNRRVPVYLGVVGAYATQKQIINKLDNAFGEWNVRIKPNDVGGSDINVNITNIIYYFVGEKLQTQVSTPISNLKSTGVFENLLFKMIDK